MEIIHSDPQIPTATIDRERLRAICRDLLITLGQDPDSPGLAETPRRWADWWGEFLDYDPGQLGTTFVHETSDQLVIVRGIRVWSLCEHHLLPFWCDITIGYVPAGQVLGLSKFARIAHAAAHRLQLQERLVKQIAEQVESLTGSPHVAVMGSGEHLCMTMRGIRSPARMITHSASGDLKIATPSRDLWLQTLGAQG